MPNYVNNKKFLKLLKEYKETESKKVYNEIGKNFILIAENLLNKTNFINYTQDRKDEMISDATYTMCRYIKLYKTEKSNNPFSYFTRIAYNCFRQNLNYHKKLNKHFISLSFIENFDNNTDMDYDLS